MLDMAKKDILPAASEYKRSLGDTILCLQAADENADCTYEKETLTEISRLIAKAYAGVKGLEKALTESKIENVTERSLHYKENVLGKMKEIREAADALECVVSSDYWPFPTYGDLLFTI